MIAGAAVAAINHAAGVKQTTKSDVQGRYSFPVLPVGQYAIEIALDLRQDCPPGNLEINHNPRNGQPYFNTSLFKPNALGTPGTSPRRFFYGPGISNFDMALHKVTKLTESKSLEFRMETFNTFNHAQFYPDGSVDGNVDSATFGHVLKAAAPRIGQLALKFSF